MLDTVTVGKLNTVVGRKQRQLCVHKRDQRDESYERAVTVYSSHLNPDSSHHEHRQPLARSSRRSCDEHGVVLVRHEMSKRDERRVNSSQRHLIIQCRSYPYNSTPTTSAVLLICYGALSQAYNMLRYQCKVTGVTSLNFNYNICHMKPIKLDCTP